MWLAKHMCRLSDGVLRMPGIDFVLLGGLQVFWRRLVSEWNKCTAVLRGLQKQKHCLTTLHF